MPKEIVLDLPFSFLAPILGVNLLIICNKHMWCELKDNEGEQSIRDSQIIEQIGEMLERYLSFISKLKDLDDIIPLLHEDEKTKHSWNIPHTGDRQ
ncbi:hypothetical protein [Rickettsia endosymbiont of Cantharis rufa]|uniref:hypothetical protein n=1 Tax=Rickettsia endosymbiont of Cantharis rufa TaxID=3066248 RepID=UPI003132D4FE